MTPQSQKADIETLEKQDDFACIPLSNASPKSETGSLKLKAIRSIETGDFQPDTSSPDRSFNELRTSSNDLLDDVEVSSSLVVDYESSKSEPVTSNDGSQPSSGFPYHDSVFVSSLDSELAKLFPEPPRKRKIEESNPILDELLHSAKTLYHPAPDFEYLYEEFMNDDPQDSIWECIDNLRSPSPVLPLMFSSSPKRPATPPPKQRRIKNDVARSLSKRAVTGATTSGSSDSGNHSRSFSSWNNSSSSNRNPNCNTSIMIPMPSTSSYIPQSETKKALFEDNGLFDTPSHPAPLLRGVTCYVDVIVGGENRSKLIRDKCIRMGAKVEDYFTKKVTHVIFKQGKMRTFLKALENGTVLVSPVWLNECQNTGQLIETKFHKPTCFDTYMKEKAKEEALNLVEGNNMNTLTPAPAVSVPVGTTPDESTAAGATPKELTPAEEAAAAVDSLKYSE